MEMLQAVLTYFAIICEFVLLGIVLGGFILTVVEDYQSKVSFNTLPINYFPDVGA